MTYTLTAEQEEIVALREGSYLVLAPPGAGKTEVLAQRVTRLLKDSPDESFRVLALTYNNRAAAQMRDRVSQRLGDVSWRATIDTYHAFYLDMLRHYGTPVGVPAEVTIYDTVDARVQALLQGLENEGMVEAIARESAVQVLDSISELRRKLVRPSAAPSTPSPVGVSLREAFNAYESVLRKNGALDFDSILTKSYELLIDHPQVARHFRRMYRYILVDEAQDTSTLQFELLKALCGEEHRNVFMVADPDQLINRWLGADEANLSRFVEDFAAQRVQLTSNFRCATQIGSAAGRLLEAGGASASVVAHPCQATGFIEARSYASELMEAGGVADWVVNLRSNGLDPSWLADEESEFAADEQFAILARSRVHLRHIVEEFETRGIPFSLRSGDAGPFDTRLYVALLDSLRVLANPRDVALRRTLVAEVSALGSSDPTEIGQLLDGDAETFIGRLSTVAGEPLGRLLENLAKAASVSIEAAMTAALVPLAEEAGDSEAALLLRGDRELLQERWNRYRYSVNSREHKWPDFIGQVVADPRQDDPGVRISTVHAAKGLEFTVVVVVGVNDGAFPDFRSTSPEALKSEVRLAYVAMTRAARCLLITRPRTRVTRYGNSRSQDESRFVRMAGLEMKDL